MVKRSFRFPPSFPPPHKSTDQAFPDRVCIDRVYWLPFIQNHLFLIWQLSFSEINHHSLSQWHYNLWWVTEHCLKCHCSWYSGWLHSSHHQTFPWLFQDISIEALQSAPCNTSDTKRNARYLSLQYHTHICSHNYVRKALFFFFETIWCTTLPSKELLSCTFCVKNNTCGNWPHARTLFPRLLLYLTFLNHS